MAKHLLLLSILISLSLSLVAQETKSQKTNQPSKEGKGIDSTKFTSDMYLQGQSDAEKYYKGYKSAGAGTFWISLVTGPILGLVPAIACGATPPHEQNLMYPTPELIKDPEYSNGYKNEAYAIKKRRVWGNWEIVVLINACVLTTWYVASK